MKRAILTVAILGILAGGVFWMGDAAVASRPVRIGFAAQLTGNRAELGVQERNGVQLAIEEMNEAGGLLGHPVELLSRDDAGDPDTARAVDEELAALGVEAIIGHATSEMSKAGLEAATATETVLLSPTTSTPELSGLDDWFFRVYPSFETSASRFARTIRREDDIGRIAVVSDSDNGFYSGTYERVFVDSLRAEGGEVVSDISFSSSSRPDFGTLLLSLRESEPEGVLIIASDMDTALIAQNLRILGVTAPLYTSAWAQTEALIRVGGRSVEGMKIELSWQSDSREERFLRFQARYLERFGASPTFGAAFGYEAAKVLGQAIETSMRTHVSLREALTGIRQFEGLNGTFSIDAFGDVRRPFFLSIVRDGRFEAVGVLSDGAGEDTP